MRRTRVETTIMNYRMRTQRVYRGGENRGANEGLNRGNMPNGIGKS